MLQVSMPDALAEAIAPWKEQGDRIAFVPTMGALHAGHLSLVSLAKTKADKVVTSIFVNPTQFAPHEDFESYPRNQDSDLKMFEEAGVDLVYLPSVETIYPDGQESEVKTGPAAEGLESNFRPHFFCGVLNVVHRLFKQVKPDIAIFGEKDFQQYQVIKESVEALGLPIEIIAGPIIRDEHGLALSSRNAYLSPEELEVARMLNQVIYNAAQQGDLEEAKEMLLTAGFYKVDYVERRWDRILAAAWIGKTRLIDNCAV